MVSKASPLALDQGPELAQGGPGWGSGLDWTPDTSKELSGLQETSENQGKSLHYHYQEKSLQRHCIDG